ncbi:MarR family winged helix-turn-helix transcriptional regulator [Chryseobacterium sp. A301]
MKFGYREDLRVIVSLMDTVREIRKVVRSHFAHKMKEQNIDITIEMLEVLSILWRKEGINQQEIVEKTNRNKASITSLIDNMTTRGLVRRDSDPLDRRSNLIYLTKEGVQYQEKLKPLLEEIYESFQSDIDYDQLVETNRVLEKIYQKILEKE